MEEEKDEAYSAGQIALQKFKDNRTVHIIRGIYAVFMLLIAKNVYSTIQFVLNLSTRYVYTNLFIGFFELAAPIITWIISTKYTYWNFHRQKKFGLILIGINITTYVELAFMYLDYRLLLPYVIKMPIGPSITKLMVLNLCRLCMLVIPSVLTLMVMKPIIQAVTDKYRLKILMEYKVDRGKDTRSAKKKQFAYDTTVIKRMEDGSEHTIPEDQRSMHEAVIGSTGTGKTSSVMTTAINDDFTHRMRNEDYQKEQIYKLLKADKVYMLRDFEDEEFDIDYISAKNEEMLKEIRKIKDTAPLAGLTAMAPNASFADEVYNLAKEKGIRNVQRLDPELDADGNHKEGYIGFNPYFISPQITGEAFIQQVMEKAEIASNVLQAVYDKSGTTDPYFMSVNQNISITVAATIMLTYRTLHAGAQPTLIDFQNCINNFQKIKPYRDELIRIYGVNKNPNGEPIMDVGRADVGRFQFLLDTIDADLLGPGAVKMNDQARGLRNIINLMLINPLVRQTLCPEQSIDMDAMLANGQITVVNYCVKLGNSGVAFGLFFNLSFIKAVLRRPGTEKTRRLHFYYIDEYPLLLHREQEAMFTYFRQFKVSMTVAIQTLDQMDKDKSTAFLRGVVQGNCATQIIFGRASVTEMETYQKLAGQIMEYEETKGYSQTALSVDNPNYTETMREVLKATDAFTTNDIRMRDFQEVTVFTVIRNTPVTPFIGRVDFLAEHKKMQTMRKRYNWHKFYDKNNVVLGLERVTDNIVEHAAKVAVTHINRDEDGEEEEKKETKPATDTVATTNMVIDFATGIIENQNESNNEDNYEEEQEDDYDPFA